MKLLKNVGRLEIKSLGITLTQDSKSSDVERALKHEPTISKFIEQTKINKNDKKEK